MLLIGKKWATKTETRFFRGKMHLVTTVRIDLPKVLSGLEGQGLAFIQDLTPSISFGRRRRVRKVGVGGQSKRGIVAMVGWSTSMNPGSCAVLVH